MSETATRVDHPNIADAMSQMARAAPHRAAVVFPVGEAAPSRSPEITFGELDSLSARYAAGLRSKGLERGDRALVMIRPGPDLIAVVFALMKLGAVPVLIDPGLPRSDMLDCIEAAEPVAFIGIPVAQLLRRLFPRPFRSVRVSVTASTSRWWLGATLGAMRARPAGQPSSGETSPDDEAAVAFTSGSTGVPKGVVYTHGNFRAQVAIMRDAMGIRPGDVHLACVHIFALFNPALGVTTVIPDMDPARPATVEPARLVSAIEAHGVTFSLGSPTIWRRVAGYCDDNDVRLQTLRKVYMFGAPVMPELVGLMKRRLVKGEVYTPYGATEALPVTQIAGEEILAETAAGTDEGGGVCVGRPIGGAEVRVIRILEEPIARWYDGLEVPLGNIGEIIVKGPVVTREYLNRPRQTAEVKIRNGDAFWHRMGDLGYLDAKGRLWFCGRKSHRVETDDGLMLPIPCETPFNAHPRVARSALVGIGTRGRQKPVLVVEPRQDQGPRSTGDEAALANELRALARRHEHTRAIQTVLFHGPFPMDVRHNAKIQREKLAAWAEETLR